MTLFIDGDAFPNLLKPIVLRAIERLSLHTKVVANKKIHIGKSKHIEYIIVDQGADEADHLIVELCKEGDLVITADIDTGVSYDRRNLDPVVESPVPQGFSGLTVQAV